MCRYGYHNYRDHFACFHCRKAFKSWQWNDRRGETWKARARLHYGPREVVCPDCARPMIDMGLDFKAPPKPDREAWEIMKILSRNGFTFHNCGCGGPGFKPPRRLRELSAWLEAHRKPGAGESLLRKFSARRG